MACVMLLIYGMILKIIDWKDFSVLDGAIIAGLAAIFLAIAVPLMRGAILRQHAAECARKVIQAADAFDFYASVFSRYPQSQQNPQQTEAVMKGAFAVYDIDWWEAATELGGQWDWCSDQNGAAVVISGKRLSEHRMLLLDRLIDDGDLRTGTFQRCGSRYQYMVRAAVL